MKTQREKELKDTEWSSKHHLTCINLLRCDAGLVPVTWRLSFRTSLSSRMAQPAPPVVPVVPLPLAPQDPNVHLPPVPAAPPNSNDVLRSVKYQRNVLLSLGVS
jgi:hypothetical protein